MRRCDSAAIVPNTSELLPEPETPVNTVSRRFGISMLTSLRLFTRAPWTRIRSWSSAACWAGRLSILVVMLVVAPICWRSGSAHRLLHERDDLRLFGCGQLLQREGGGPHGACVEVRLVAEAERRVPGVELLGALEEADDLVVPGVRGHPV